MVISIWTALRIGRTEIVDLLKAARRPKGQLIFSPWLVAVSAVCLAAAYGMAVMMDIDSFVVLALPILITVVVGTYFLFTQLSILLLRLIQKRTSVYYKRTNMMIFAQLGYKIKDNARILFIVSILSAVIMTALGTVYIMQISGKKEILESNPFTIAYRETGLNTHEVIDPAQIKRMVAEDGFEIVKEAKAVGVVINRFTVKWEDGAFYENKYDMDALIISATDYNKLAEMTGKPLIHPDAGKLTLTSSFYGESPSKNGIVKGYINGKETEYVINDAVDSKPMNLLDNNYYMFIMDDFSYVKLAASIPEDQINVMYGFELSDWETSAATVEKLNQLVAPEKLNSQTDFRRAARFNEMQESISLTLFIGLFISLLFFIASGSMIYFKLFTELQEDQAQFKALSRIGMTKGEIRKIVVTQIGIIFFVPVVVGISHALFAMKALDNIMGSSNWFYSFIVIGIYIAMQTLYFLIACSSYMKSMLRSASA